MRAGLSALLSSDEEIRVVNDDSFGAEDEADVVVTSASMDFSGENSAAILFLSDGQFNVEDMKRSTRVWGVLRTEASAEELVAAVRALSQGLVVGSPELLFGGENEPLERGPLTDREAEVLGLLARGLANKQIAAALGISEHTVKFHVSSIYTKLNVTNRAEAVSAGLRGGWIAL
jgi:DNA-binding NarL/FixJ family response regulator